MFCWNIHFNLIYVLGKRRSISWISRQYILVPNFVFLFFQSFFIGRREKESPNSGLKKENGLWGRFWPPKQLIFVSKGFIWWGELCFGVFSLTLKTPKITYLSSGRIFVPSGFRISGFGWFFDFLVATNWFNKVFMMFSKCFGLKIGWNEIFWWKNNKPYFSDHHSDRILGWSKRHVFLKYLGHTTYHPPH